MLFASLLLMLAEASKKGGKKCGKKRVVRLATHQCECTADTAGTLNYRDGKVLVCNGKDWSGLKLEGAGYGSADQPGHSCKDILGHGKKENGIYHITLAGVYQNNVRLLQLTCSCLYHFCLENYLEPTRRVKMKSISAVLNEILVGGRPV